MEVDALVECVPNFSEGRDCGRIFAIVDSLRAPGVLLLDYSADPDHNRMVVTIAGPPDAVREAAVNAVGVASRLIDLREHRGVHLRMGAADVVPFVPIRGISLERTAELARLAGQEMWQRHRVPVFYYEAAAMDPARRRLEQLRRGQFEGAIADGRQPDVGDALHAAAGASIVGARDFLVAWNVLLDTPEVGIAKEIARRIRMSGGGFAGVKALGVPAKGLAQVTMNITDYRVAPVEAVYQRVKELAAAHGTRIVRGELIGLVPRAAFDARDEWFTTIPGFDEKKRIVEERLRNPMAWPASISALEA